MQIHTEQVRAIVLAIAVAAAFWVLPYQVKTMPIWIPYLVDSVCGLMVIGVILSMTPVWGKMFGSGKLQSPVRADLPPTEYYQTLRIVQQEPNKQPPVILDAALVCIALLTLFAVGLEIYLFATGKLPISQINTRLVLSLVVYVGMSVWLLISTFLVEPKYRKLGKSAVAREKQVDVKGNAGDIFLRAVKTIAMEPHIIWKLDTPKLIRARWRHATVTVTTTNVGHGVVRTNITSDGRWTTTRFDFGTNQRNVEALVRAISQQPPEPSNYPDHRTTGIDAEGSIINAPRAKIRNQDIGIKSKDSKIDMPDSEITDDRPPKDK